MKKSIKITILLSCIIIAIMSIYSYVYSTENVHLGKYKGLSTKMTTYNVTDGDIQTSLNELAKKYPNKKKIKKGQLENNQKASVDYSYTLDEKLIKNEDYEITVGVASIGFEDKLSDMIVGESKKIIVNYSDDDSDKTVAGKTITYHVKVNYIIEESTPEITDEFIKKNTKYKTVEEYKNYLKKEFISSYEKNAEATAGNTLIQQIIKTSRIRKYPTKDVEKYKKNIKASYEDAATQMNLTFEKLLKYMDMTEDEFNEKLEKEANFYVSKKMIVQAIAKKKFISISDDEFNAYLKTIADTYQDFDSLEDVQTYIEENKTEEDLRYDALAEKVIKYLLKHNKIEKISEDIEYQSISVQL